MNCSRDGTEDRTVEANVDGERFQVTVGSASVSREEGGGQTQTTSGVVFSVKQLRRASLSSQCTIHSLIGRVTAWSSNADLV